MVKDFIFVIWECYLSVRHRGCPVSDTSAALPNLRIRNVSKAAGEGDFGRRLVYVRGSAEEIARFEALCRENECVRDIQEMSETGTEAYFTLEIEYTTETPSILELINDRGIFYHGTTGVNEGEEQWFVYSRQKADIRELVADIEAHGNDVTVNRIVDLEQFDHVGHVGQGHLLSELTPQQLRTFETALEMRYYDQDSDTIVENIAEELDRHETTTWEHLKKAENTILTAVGGQLFATRTERPSGAASAGETATRPRGEST